MKHHLITNHPSHLASMRLRRHFFVASLIPLGGFTGSRGWRNLPANTFRVNIDLEVTYNKKIGSDIILWGQSTIFIPLRYFVLTSVLPSSIRFHQGSRGGGGFTCFYTCAIDSPVMNFSGWFTASSNILFEEHGNWEYLEGRYNMFSCKQRMHFFQVAKIYP